jgi:hypothetical protein
MLTLVYASSIVFCLTLSLSCMCRGASLRKRGREDGPSFEPDSKRAKLDLDDAKASSSNPSAPELIPEPESPQASTTSDASFYSAIGDGDEPNFIALDDPESLFNVLCETFAKLMEARGTALPSNWSLQEFTREVIGEEMVQDPSYLADVYSNLVECGLNSCYWEHAFDIICLLHVNN